MLPHSHTPILDDDLAANTPPRPTDRSPSAPPATPSNQSPPTQGVKVPIVPTPTQPTVNRTPPVPLELPPDIDYIDLSARLDRLEETILASPRVPLTGKTIINEEELLEQIDAIRLELPESVKAAVEIVRYREDIVAQAQQRAREIVAAAEQEAMRITNQLGITERAEQQARALIDRTAAECQRRHQATIGEIDRLRADSLIDVKQMRQQILQECQDIQADADEYADNVLANIEGQLGGILQTIQQGRRNLQPTDHRSTKS